MWQSDSTTATADSQTASVTDTASVAEAEEPILVEFAQLWARGMADEFKLWQLFDVCEMYMYRPDYFGAPVFRNGDVLMTPVFSSVDLLTEFVAASPELGVESGAEGFDWVRITGTQLFGLPVRARYLAIDPGLEHGVVVDLASRVDPPPLANDAPPFGINLELTTDPTDPTDPTDQAVTNNLPTTREEAT